MIKRNHLCLLSSFLFVLFAATPSLSQEGLGKGRINGEVIDENGTPVEGALITVESLRAGTKLEGKSDKKGHFAVAGMGTGMWRITATKPGYASSSVDMNIRQLTTNPPVTFTLKKMVGLAALKTDEESFALFDRGNSLIQEEKYDEALEVFEEFLAKYPEIYQAHLNVGTCYLKKNELDKAAAEFQLVLDKALRAHGDYKKDPEGTFRAFSGLGEIYLKKGDFEAAQKQFSQALEISPKDEVAAYNVGEVFFSNQQIDDAIKYFELAIQIKKDWSKPYVKLGYVYLNKGDFPKSLEYFNAFIQMDPENPEVPQVKNVIAAIEKMKK
ncbi:MAG: tetratricopeptide repeat protein [Candidatus Aminicenantes bacterium]|nr:tetratricopeptide repeat protein [Candidatus Aminicenantes bacterium]